MRLTFMSHIKESVTTILGGRDLVRNRWRFFQIRGSFFT